MSHTYKENYSNQSDYEETQSHLDRYCEVIKFDDPRFPNIEIKKLRDILYYLLVKSARTVYVSNGNQQCSTGRARTSEDAYLLNKYYLKNPFSFQEVEELIYSYHRSGLFRMTRSYCGTILRNVHTVSNPFMSIDEFYKLTIKHSNNKKIVRKIVPTI